MHYVMIAFIVWYVVYVILTPKKKKETEAKLAKKQKYYDIQYSSSKKSFVLVTNFPITESFIYKLESSGNIDTHFLRSLYELEVIPKTKRKQETFHMLREYVSL